MLNEDNLGEKGGLMYIYINRGHGVKTQNLQ